MNLNHSNWYVDFDLAGGRISNLSHMGKKVLGTYKRIDGKVGNTHLCVPSFDREGQEKYSLPFHGLVRNEKWNLEEQTENTARISIITAPVPFYPATLKVEQRFSLEGYFTHTVTISHLSGEEVPVNIGIHYYWDTPQGWDTFRINDASSAEGIKTNGTVPLKKRNIIQFPHASYELLANGLHSTVLWASFKTNIEDQKQFNTDFCCIEPVIDWPGYFGTQKSILSFGEKKIVSITIKAETI